MKHRRWGRLGAALLAMSIPITACNHSSPSTSPTTAANRAASSSTTTASVSSCGYLFELDTPSLQLDLGGCAGTVPDPPADASLRVGQRLRLVAVDNADGHPAIEAPTSQDPGIVRLVSSANYGGEATYEAIAPGKATLQVSSAVCQSGPAISVSKYGVIIRSCPLLIVAVTP